MSIVSEKCLLNKFVKHALFRDNWRSEKGAVNHAKTTYMMLILLNFVWDFIKFHVGFS